MNCQVAQKLQVPPPNTLGPAILEYQSNAEMPESLQLLVLYFTLSHNNMYKSLNSCLLWNFTYSNVIAWSTSKCYSMKSIHYKTFGKLWMVFADIMSPWTDDHIYWYHVIHILHGQQRTKHPVTILLASWYCLAD